MLPAGGYQGDPPEFPLPDGTDREVEVWREAWRSPQAFAWATESWRWYTVGMWVRWSVRSEDPSAPAAIGNVVVRLADQIGLTPAGLSDNEWRIADEDEPTQRVAAGDRRTRPGVPSVRERLNGAPVQPNSLERARQRAEQRNRDPRDVLSDRW